MRFLLLLSVFFTAAVWAASAPKESQNTMYRFKNADGVWELTYQLSTEAYQAGYQVLQGGQVIETVPPPPTEAQLKERAVAEEVARQKKEQDTKDQQLLKTYSSVDDAVRARDRKVNQMQVMTEITQARIHQMQADNEKLVADAANAQQLGLSVYDTIVNKIQVNEKEIDRLQKFINAKNQEKQAALDEFQAIIDRLKFLNAPETSTANADETAAPAADPAPVSSAPATPTP
jgi:hypothetical protein